MDDSSKTNNTTGSDETLNENAATSSESFGRLHTEWEEGDVILDLYEVQGKSEGGMGIVYFVWHRGWQTKLAMKSPKPELVTDENAYKRFVREAETWVDLGLHPYIASCYYVRDIDGLPRIFAEYIDGGDLKTWIKGGKVKHWRTILDLAIQFCDGMSYAHSKGLIHRDIKPANCLMTGGGDLKLKITDFGLVKTGAEQLVDINCPEELLKVSGDTITMSASGMGTPQYMAPEQWHRAKEVGPQADIYSFGVMLYEMCCGRRPFECEEEPVKFLYLKHRLSEPPDPKKIRDDIPTALTVLILNCLAKQPGERYASFSVVRKKLAILYQKVTGETFAKEVPEESEIRADALNNKGVSFYDLGRMEDGRSAFKEALKYDPQHLQATKNLGIIDWNEGKITDLDFLMDMYAIGVSQDYGFEYQKALADIHISRGALSEAAEVLKEGLRLSAENVQLKGLLLKTQKSMKEDSGWSRILRKLVGHGSAVFSVAITPDGRFGLSGSADQTLRLWDLKKGECLRTFEGHSDNVNTVTISVDGRFGLSGSTDKTLRLWKLNTGECLRIYMGHHRNVYSVSMSQDRRFGLSGSSDETLRLWDLETGECLKVLKGHSAPVTSVTISPDSKYGLSGGDYDKTLRLWDLATGECLRIFKNHEGSIGSVSISYNGKFGLSGSSDNTIRLWDLFTGECLRTFNGHSGTVTAVVFDSKSRFVLSSSWDKTVRIWDLSTGQCLRSFEGFTGYEVLSIAVRSDRRYGIVGLAEASLGVLNTDLQYISPPMDLAIVKTIEILKKDEDRVIRLIKDTRKTLYEGNIREAIYALVQARKIPGFERDRRLIELWNEASEYTTRVGLRTAWINRTLEGHERSVESLSFNLDGKTFVSGGGDNFLKHWDLDTGKCIQIFKGHERAVYSIAISPDGKFVLSGSGDSTVRLWDLKSGECIQTMKGHKNCVNSVAFSPDGNFGLSVSEDKTLRIWELFTGNCHSTIEAADHNVCSLAISPDGRFMLTGSWHDIAGIRPNGKFGFSGKKGPTLRLWDFESKKCIFNLKEHEWPVFSVAITPDGRFGLSGSADQTLRLWDLKKGECLRTFEGHSDNVNTVTISVDGRFGLSGSTDKTLRLWDLSTEECLRVLEGHKDSIRSVAFSLDARYAISGSADGEFIIWELDWELSPEREPKTWKEEYGLAEPISTKYAQDHKESLLSTSVPSQIPLKPKRSLSRFEINFYKGLASFVIFLFVRFLWHVGYLKEDLYTALWVLLIPIMVSFFYKAIRGNGNK